MKKIGISTVHTGYNYGSSLQSYASKIFLNELGYQGVSLGLKGSIVKGRDVRLKKIAIIFFRLMRQPSNIIKRFNVYNENMRKPYSKQSKELFDLFRENNIQPQYFTWRELKALGNQDEFKAFICGSDQIWNAEALYVDPQYYLQFAPQEKRVAFAPSFGREEIAEYNKKTVMNYINKIPYLSVREESGVSIIKDLTNRNAIQLIDPTLLLTREKWDEKLGINNLESPDEKYLLAYFLNEPSEYAKQYMAQLAKENNLKIYALPYEGEGNDWYDFTPHAGPIEFVHYIKHASYVCTDSFHGTAFSVNYQIPFFTFDRQYGSAGKQSSRLSSLLKLIEFEERFNPSLDLKNLSVEFSKSNSVLESEREVAAKYLYSIFRMMEDK